MKLYLDRFKLNDVYSFQTKISLIKDAYYKEQFGFNDVFKSFVSTDYDNSFVCLFGIYFDYVVESECFKLRDREYSFMEVICIVDSLFRYMNSINKQGFVNETVLDNCFMNSIMDFLETRGYEKMILGN